MSYQAWQRDYAGDPSVIGSTFVMNTHPVTVVGVTPQAFYGDRMSERPPDFLSSHLAGAGSGFYAVRNIPDLGWLYLIGRVKPGTAMASLQAKSERPAAAVTLSAAGVPDRNTAKSIWPRLALY